VMSLRGCDGLCAAAPQPAQTRVLRPTCRCPLFSGSLGRRDLSARARDLLDFTQTCRSRSCRPAADSSGPPQIDRVNRSFSAASS
jgi:hypothetical protein